MVTAQPRDKIFSFLGEDLLELTVLRDIDALRIEVEDDECTYCIYKVHCYNSPEEAFIGMQKAMLYWRKKYNL